MTSARHLPATADAVVVGGGTIGAWTAWFLRRSGLRDVVLLEAGRLGQGASSRAAGMVRAQGAHRGRRAARHVQPGLLPQAAGHTRHRLGLRRPGVLHAVLHFQEVREAHTRIAMQRRLGLDVEWVEPDEVDAANPAMAPGLTLGASYAAGDGYIDAPCNVLAYTAALFTSGVHVAERTAFTGLEVRGGAVNAVTTSVGTIATERVVLTGGPTLAAVGRAAGVRIPAGGARHQVVATGPHPQLAADRLPMVFDVASGIYWRPSGDGGVLWGMSNPDEPPGEAADFDWAYFDVMRQRVATLLPATSGLGLRRAWAATIDYTPDHLPILGPAITAEGPIHGTTVAAAGGHGMMWGPGVARVAADLCLRRDTDLVDVGDLGLDRFDENGRSRLAPDPVALPFPVTTGAIG